MKQALPRLMMFCLLSLVPLANLHAASLTLTNGDILRIDFQPKPDWFAFPPDVIEMFPHLTDVGRDAAGVEVWTAKLYDGSTLLGTYTQNQVINGNGDLSVWFHDPAGH